MAAAPSAVRAAVSVGGWMQHSPDDISGFSTLSGDNNTVNVTLPFTFTVEGTNFTTLTLSTNGWIEFGTNTSGNSDESNDCLPTSVHTNPFLAAYWDDLNPFGTSVRYGTVGAANGRVFIADFETDLTAGVEGQDDLRFQIQLHERSNVITVRYRDTQNQANGQGATIGFQGAGGAAASTVQPLICNGKLLDDNRPDEGWSADVGRAGLVTMAAHIAHSPDDLPGGFATLSGNDAIAGPTMPFSVDIEGTNYNTLTIGTNGIIQFGTTSGSNPSGNTALPSASFPNPTLLFYWDDLQTEGSNIRYGTVGSSPNRTFIVDFQANTVAASGDKVNGQVQIHERSNLINVKYRSTISPGANGQSATIGFQGGGGASAVAYPLTFNGKVLDDDRPDEGFSIHPKALGALSLHAIMESSPNDISGFTTLSGDNAIAGVTLPFSVGIDGTSYSTLTIGTNGIIQFGTLAGANPTTNVSLPSASFPNPTLFYFWDDIEPEGGFIRYGTVGTSPHRTFIVDFQEHLTASSGDKVNGQVQIHEGSNVFNVTYRSTLSAPANGQSATIGFQSAGGASATAYPLTFNGKILDDNLPNAGWSVAPLPVCGNGMIETKEQCDAGAANGTLASCCSATCGFKTNGTACTDDGNVCTDDQCNGASATCQHPTNSAPCSDALFCNGVDTCGGGTCSIHAGDPCPGADGDANCAETCNEAADDCSASDPNGSACTGNGTGECSNADACLAGLCQNNDVAPGVSCTDTAPPSSGNCQDAQCNGAGLCDQSFAGEPNGAACDDALFCNGADTCSAGACAAHAGDPCAGPDGDTDCSESCDEGADDCAASDPDGTLCRPDAGECDVQETCVTGSCPANDFEPSGTGCGDPSDTDCTNPDTCDSGGTCLGNHEVSGFACGDASDTECSDPDSCDGAGACESNHEAPGTTCTDDGEVCTEDECDAVGACAHPAGNAGALCRAASPGQLCDEAELCDGSNPTCPADGVKPLGTTCRPDAGECDLAEQCDGSSSACPADVFEPSGTACGDASDTDCSNPDTCDGGGSCQANHETSSVVCRAASAGQACDAAELCDGAGNCPADGVLPSGTSCRAAAGECDLAESCDGSSSACPSDVLAPPGAPCSTDSNVCTLDQCDGSGTCAHPAGNAGAVCRPDAGLCDVAETCDGLSTTCPADGSEPDGTGCSDGLFCNGVDTCAAGECVSPGTPCGSGETCSEAGDECLASGCPAAPASCATAGKSLLLIKNESNDAKDKLIWKWIKGAAATQADFADPKTTAEYTFCLYAGGSLLTQAVVPPSSLWKDISDKGFKYKDKTGAADGIQKIMVKGTGVAAKSKALIKGKGANLPFASLTLPINATPVVAQLRNNATGFCMQGSYATPIKSTDRQYKAKQ